MTRSAGLQGSQKKVRRKKPVLERIRRIGNYLIGRTNLVHTGSLCELWTLSAETVPATRTSNLEVSSGDANSGPTSWNSGHKYALRIARTNRDQFQLTLPLVND